MMKFVTGILTGLVLAYAIGMGIDKWEKRTKWVTIPPELLPDRGPYEDVMVSDCNWGGSS